MEVKLQKGEKCRINYQDCPSCGNTFNTTNRKKTFHHAVPLFLKPQTIIEVSICKECHEKLNSSYVHTTPSTLTVVGKNQPKSFKEFLDNYKLLRDEFEDITKKKPKTENGKFGEGLWFNLVNYLEHIDEQLKLLGAKQ